MPPQFENNNVPPANLENHHRDPSILIILIVVMLLSGAGAVWYILNLPPEPTPQPMTKVDQFADTSNWQTYRNEEYGFEFKYPYSFKLDITPTKMIVLAENPGDKEFPGIWIEMQSNPNQLPLKEWWLQTPGDHSQEKYNEISIDGVNGIKVELLTGFEEETYLLPHDKKIILITTTIKNLIPKILSTFKFISTSTLSVPPCDHFSNYYKDIDKNIIDKAKENAEVLRFINEGYTLQNICNSTNKNLAIFDSNDKYWKDAPNVTSEELYRIGSRLLFWITDDKFLTGTFYKLSIDDYRFEGTGGMACNFDKISGNNILFICVNAGDGGTDTTWYAYNTLSQNNFMVRSKLKMRYSDLGNKDQIYDASLLKLFSYQ